MLMRMFAVLLVVGVIGLGTMGCSMLCCPATAKAAACQCADGKGGKDLWCADCNKGYVGGKAVTCKGCFAAKTGGEACKACAAKKKEG